MSETVAPTALPPPAIPPEDVNAIMPDLSPEQAALAAQLATVAVEAALYPNPIPDPIPAPVYSVLIQASVRFGTAIAQGTALPIISQSLGSYSERLAAPVTLPGAFGLTEEQLEQLLPWSGGGHAFELHLRQSYAWPADYWQRDYDRLDAPPEEEA